MCDLVRGDRFECSCRQDELRAAREREAKLARRGARRALLELPTDVLGHVLYYLALGLYTRSSQSKAAS